jgi:hypothetical protein
MSGLTCTRPKELTAFVTSIRNDSKSVNANVYATTPTTSIDAASAKSTQQNVNPSEIPQVAQHILITEDMYSTPLIIALIKDLTRV